MKLRTADSCTYIYFNKHCARKATKYQNFHFSEKNNSIMNWVAGSSQNSWQPIMTTDSTVPSYWFNWRVAVCSIWIILSMAAASFIIWKHEGLSRNRPNIGEVSEEPRGGHLYEEEVWRTSLKDIHPVWLLAFRIVAFVLLATLLIVNVIVDGGGILYFYTQWTFALVTIYFGLGSLLSIYGCHQFFSRVGEVDQTRIKSEGGLCVVSVQGSLIDARHTAKSTNNHDACNAHRMAGIWGYIFQILFQTCAGAVMLTDIVFWLVFFPFLTIKDHKLNFLLVGTHSINVVFLLGDAALNFLHFCWFRIAYFVLWTAVYVIFQWIIHACVPLRWPYPFLNLSSPYAPIWYVLLLKNNFFLVIVYLLVALLHIPCYAIFALVMKMKHHLLSRRFPQTYQCRR